jgi:ABC-2 type transport system permease protein
MLLSGFMYPFQGMPHWAQAAGTALPLTHFVRISRDLLLRGATDARISDEIGWLAALSLICVAVAAAAYRRRLD